MELEISVDNCESDSEHRSSLPPPAPKRRRTTSDKASRLAAFAAAARRKDGAVEQLQAAYRGHLVRREVARLRPGSASHSESSASPEDDVPVPPEEILAADEQEEIGKDLTRLLRLSSPHAEDEGAMMRTDSALEESSELERSGESTSFGSGIDGRGSVLTNAAISSEPCDAKPSKVEERELRQHWPHAEHPNTERKHELQPKQSQHERTCSICLMHMPPSGTRPNSASSSRTHVQTGMSVATLVCGHKFHRKCLLAWCRHRAPGTCPQCREVVRVRRRASAEPSTSRPTERSGSELLHTME